MADLVNPYANPYLPSFVNQRPRLNDPNSNVSTPQMTYSGFVYCQIHSVDGFEGARSYNLANGSSEILADRNPNLARIYVTAKDSNGQMFVQGFDLIPVEEPKPVTMDDINSTMNQILERLNKLEGERRNEQSNSGTSWKSSKQSGNVSDAANGRGSSSTTESSGGSRSNGSK